MSEYMAGFCSGALATLTVGLFIFAIITERIRNRRDRLRNYICEETE